MRDRASTFECLRNRSKGTMLNNSLHVARTQICTLSIAADTFRVSRVVRTRARLHTVIFYIQFASPRPSGANLSLRLIFIYSCSCVLAFCICHRARARALHFRARTLLVIINLKQIPALVRSSTRCPLTSSNIASFCRALCSPRVMYSRMYTRTCIRRRFLRVCSSSPRHSTEKRIPIPSTPTGNLRESSLRIARVRRSTRDQSLSIPAGFEYRAIRARARDASTT